MTDPSTGPMHAPEEQPKSPFSDKREGLIDSLERLYIKNNPSGRHIFREEWPAAAALIFDARLTKFDSDGVSTPEEKTLRTKLERQADMERERFLDMAENIEKTSVQREALQLDVVKQIIEKYGRDFALCLYADHVVDKLAPPPVVEAPQEEQPEVAEGMVDVSGIKKAEDL